jgi:hypothetical protein
MGSSMVLVIEPASGGRLEHALPLPSGADPLRYLERMPLWCPALRQATAWCEVPETRAQREARLRGAPTPPSTTAPSPTATPTAEA